MEISGKVIDRLPKRTGVSQNGNQWQSIEFVIQHDLNSQYPKHIVLTFFGDELVSNAIQELHRDTEATFLFDIDARKSKDGRWFNSLKCFRFNVNGSVSVHQQPQPQSAPPFIEPEPDDEIPF